RTLFSTHHDRASSPNPSPPRLFPPSFRNQSSPKKAFLFHPFANNAGRSRPLRRRKHLYAPAVTPALRALSPPTVPCSGAAERSRILSAPCADEIALQCAFPFSPFHPARCLRRRHRRSAPARCDLLPRSVRLRAERNAP